ncbi:MAG: hypothetical protein U9N40_02165 [Euryarchaeota archaeon]|nr:hypothetical protein [Euryarchaeota archaeon]
MKFEMGMRALSLLLVIALVGAIFVPAVSAENEQEDVISVSTVEDVKCVTPPEFQPSILDKLLLKPVVSELRVNKQSVEFIGAIYSSSWIEQHDQSPASDQIVISLPEDHILTKTVSSGSTVPVPEELADLIVGADDESILVLWVPKDLIYSKKNGSNVTIQFPKELLLEYPDISQFNVDIMADADEVMDTEEDKSLSSAMNPAELASRTLYQERAQYTRDSSYTVTGVTGILDPYSYSNNGRSFTSYHEIEIYLNGQDNTAEFISHILDDGSYRYWAVIWDDGDYYTMLDKTTNSLPYMEYYLYLEDGVYWFHLRNPNTGAWETNSYDDTDNPATRVDWLMGSTELYLDSGTGSFRVETCPIREDWTRTSDGSWYRPRKTFDWYTYTSNEQYVSISACWTSDDRIQTIHVGGSSV